MLMSRIKNWAETVGGVGDDAHQKHTATVVRYTSSGANDEILGCMQNCWRVLILGNG